MIEQTTRAEKYKRKDPENRKDDQRMRGNKKIKKSEDDEDHKDKRRMNERPIGYVIDRVTEWRNLFINSRNVDG